MFARHVHARAHQLRHSSVTLNAALSKLSLCGSCEAKRGTLTKRFTTLAPVLSCWPRRAERCAVACRNARRLAVYCTSPDLHAVLL